jgi:hypothetical protein
MDIIMGKNNTPMASGHPDFSQVQTIFFGCGTKNGTPVFEEEADVPFLWIR